MILTDTLSGTEPPLPAVGVENSVYLQVQSDGRITSWSKKAGVWNIVSVVGAGAFGGLRIVDLGVIDLREIYRMGVKQLIPYTAGRSIKSVFFTFDGFVDEPNNEINFVSPNVCDPTGLAVWAQIGRQFHNQLPLDTRGVWYAGHATQVDGTLGNLNGIVDSTPLYVGIHPSSSYLPISRWQASTFYCVGDFVLDSGGVVQQVQTQGLSGLTEPTWATFGDPTTDNEITWSGWALPAVGKIHAFAEIIESSSTLPVPTTIDWVTQPTDTVAGETMDPFTLRILDKNGNPCVFPNTTTGLSFQLVSTSTGGPNSQTFDHADSVTGVFTVSDCVINEAGSGMKIRAYFQGVGVSPVDSHSFNITAP